VFLWSPLRVAERPRQPDRVGLAAEAEDEAEEEEEEEGTA